MAETKMPGTEPLLDESKEQSFRTAKRTSMLRANVFAMMCMVMMLVYSLVLLRPGLLWTDLPVPKADTRLWCLFAFCFIYLLRVNAMARWLLPRELGQEELTIVPLWISCILASYALGAIHVETEMSVLSMMLSVGIYLVGSYLNTWSELQRKWWKAKPENKGRAYTIGLFSFSRNINYFGDVVLFAAWAGATGCWWNVWVPIVMAASFHFQHIPEKETYLSERYAPDWPTYAEQVPAFIPFCC